MPQEFPATTPFIRPYEHAPSQRYLKMDNQDLHQHGQSRRWQRGLWILVASYVLDWIILLIFGIVGYVLGKLTPNKRPFSLEDRDISFPFTIHETVPAWVAMIANTVAPIIIIIVISLVFVPGRTVPLGTPKALVWKRKLWELHMGLLGLGLSLISAWFITNGMKNMFGKPRPDLLSRCQPDIAHVSQYVVGGIANISSNGQLVSADICKNPDKSLVDDGFRSYPSGHSSSSAAGLLYLSLFIASKFAITIPFLAPASYTDAASYTAFPSRYTRANRGDGDLNGEAYELRDQKPRDEVLSRPSDPAMRQRLTRHRTTVAAVRRQAAAPPLYLLALCVLPFFGAVFISGSRWFDFRHHGFDILFGFFIGTLTAVFAFRYYHLPLSQGAGWAWGPRSPDKAFWAGVGSFSYATTAAMDDGSFDRQFATSRPSTFDAEDNDNVYARDDEERIGMSSTRSGTGYVSPVGQRSRTVGFGNDSREV
ncbi:hypothetical protein VTK73DRAFT_7675 [Phialemonium thermophilum]|uniref:Phosphatidic acid phosphatase type 2/haloperoxidase domain-containing protein n=1 Tax=Phialemonium thermophilum TaxID=223376 RepID=A0ABR3Y7W8_9PEZI